MCQGFDALDYAEHTDYDLVESTNPAFNKALVRINVFRSHRQACHVMCCCSPPFCPVCASLL